jgi:hypothetical protein
MGCLGDPRRQAADPREIFRRCRPQAGKAPKSLEELPFALLSQSRDFVQGRLQSCFPA